MNLFALQTLEAELTAYTLIDKLLSLPHTLPTRYSEEELAHQWTIDKAILSKAEPFAWTEDPITAVLIASRSIPVDTCLTRKNLNKSAVWWYFEEPLPFNTVADKNIPIRAISGGWVSVRNTDKKLFIISCWIESETFSTTVKDGASPVQNPRGLAPSQVFSWFEDESIEDMLKRVSWNHDKMYGEGGRWRSLSNIVGKPTFMQTTVGLAHFILAGLAWLDSKVLVAEVPDVPRQRRKEYRRVLGRDSDIKLIRLRREDRPNHDTERNNDPTHRDFAYRFVVRGHWRNQPYGPGRAEHRLTWIMPFVKGPDDKPLREKLPVYVVNR